MQSAAHPYSVNTEIEYASQLRHLLQEKVCFAYLFGSATRGRLTCDSDLDVAIFHRSSTVQSRGRFDLALFLSEKLGRDVDLV